MRETTCPGHLVDAYVPLAPRTAARFRSLRAALSSAETELSYLPEYYYWDGITPTPVGCPAGGGTNNSAAVTRIELIPKVADLRTRCPRR